MYIMSSKVTPTCPTFTQIDAYISDLFSITLQALDALGIVPSKSQEVFVKREVPLFNLKVSTKVFYEELM